MRHQQHSVPMQRPLPDRYGAQSAIRGKRRPNRGKRPDSWCIEHPLWVSAQAASAVSLHERVCADRRVYFLPGPAGAGAEASAAEAFSARPGLSPTSSERPNLSLVGSRGAFSAQAEPGASRTTPTSGATRPTRASIRARAFQTPNRLVINYVYPLPFGRGQAVLCPMRMERSTKS